MSKQIFPYGTGSLASVTATVTPSIVWWRIYMISPVDGLIHELSMSDEASINYTEHAFSIGPRPLLNSPIAAVAWNRLADIRIYYFSSDYKVQELAWLNGNWVVGATLGDVDPRSTSLCASVRAPDDGPVAELRIGYQTPSSPNTITESFWITTEGTWGVREYPAMVS